MSTVNIDRVRLHVSSEIRRWAERLGTKDKVTLARKVSQSAMSPLIETAYLVEEVLGPDEDLTNFIDRLSSWYGVERVIGRREYENR